MARKSRDKGARNEVTIVNLLKDAGLPCQRIPLSGACAGLFLRADRREALIVLRVEDWIELMTKGKPGA